MAGYSLGEAIGLRGVYNLGTNVAEYQRGSLAQAAKDAAARRKLDEDLYADLEKRIQPPKDLEKLYRKPAHNVTVDYAARLQKLRQEGTLSSKGYDLVNEYSGLMTNMMVGSDEWRAFKKGFERDSNYTSKAQIDIKAAESMSQDIFQFAELVKKSGIPGYDTENFRFTQYPGGGSIDIFQDKINQESYVKSYLNTLGDVPIPPTGITIDGQKMISYGTQQFYLKADKEDWMRANPDFPDPSSVEEKVEAMMEDTNFVFQFADARGLSFEDPARIKEELMKLGAGYATEDNRFKNKSEGFNIYLNTGQKTTLTNVRRNATVSKLSGSTEAVSFMGTNLDGYDLVTPSLDVPPGAVTETGTPPTAPLTNAKLTSIAIYPTRVVNGIEYPIISKAGTLKSIKPSEINNFQVYVTFQAGTGKRIVPYTEAQSQIQLGKLGNDALARFQNEISQIDAMKSALQNAHKINSGNANFDLYKKLNTYLANPNLDNQRALAEYLDTL